MTVKDKLANKTPYIILSDVEYINNRTKFKVKCPKCNNEFTSCWDYLQRGRGCPECAKNARSFKQTTTNSNFLKKVSKFEYANDYEFLTEYTKASEKIKVRHIPCGHEYEVTPNKFLSGKQCPFCKGGVRYSAKQFEDKFYKKYDKTKFLLLDPYINKDTPVRVKLLKENKIYTSSNPLLMLNKEFKFKYTKTLQFHKEIFENELQTILGNEYTVIGEYKSTNMPVKIKHSCGYEYTAIPCDIIWHKTGRCPVCRGTNTSNPENDIYDFIKKIRPNDTIHKNYKIAKKEIDIYDETLKIGIEFNGLYWHSNKFKKPKDHFEKTRTCAKNGVRLIHIFEDEWDTKKDLVKSKLMHIFNVSNDQTIYGRKCIVKEITVAEKNNFLNLFHIQGEDKSNIKLGLFYKDELCAVMTFVKPRVALGQHNGNDRYELSRYATSANVIGGFGKLLKYFKEHYSYSEIYTYADLSWTAMPELTKNIYEKNNFILSHITPPNYFYVKSGVRYNRFNFTKSQLKKKFPNLWSANKTEKEIMQLAKYNIVYNCGNLCYYLKK